MTRRPAPTCASSCHFNSKALGGRSRRGLKTDDMGNLTTRDKDPRVHLVRDVGKVVLQRSASVAPHTSKTLDSDSAYLQTSNLSSEAQIPLLQSTSPSIQPVKETPHPVGSYLHPPGTAQAQKRSRLKPLVPHTDAHPPLRPRHERTS